MSFYEEIANVLGEKRNNQVQKRLIIDHKQTFQLNYIGNKQSLFSIMRKPSHSITNTRHLEQSDSHQVKRESFEKINDHSATRQSSD